MANRYWVGGTANWDATAGSKWALTSGGAGGQAVPTSSDDVFFDAASGAVIATVTATANCLSLDFTGFTGEFAGSSTVNVNANLTFSTGMTQSHIAWAFPATTGSFIITCNGKSLGSSNVNITGGAGATYGLADDFTSTGLLNVSSNLNTNNHNITIGRFAFTGTPTVNLGSSTIIVNSASQQTQVNSGVTFNAGTSTIKVNGTGVFSAAGKTFNNVEFNGTFSTTTAQNNTFNDLKIGADAVITFATGTTSTVSSFTSGGTSGHLATIKSSSAGVQFTLSRSSGTNAVSYMSITDSQATGGATWNAIDGTNVNGGGNSGWNFPPSSGFLFFM